MKKLTFHDRIHDALFSKIDVDQFLIISNIGQLLAGPTSKNRSDLTKPIDFISTEKLSPSLQKVVGLETQSNELVLPFDISFNILLKDCLERSFVDFQIHYATDTRLSICEIQQLARTHAILLLIFRYNNDPEKMKVIYQKLTNYTHGTLVRTTTFHAFRKYVSRKKRIGLPKALKHGLTGKPSNNGEISSLMKDLIILAATKQTTGLSASLIELEILHIIDNLPNADSVGLSPISVSKISKYLRTGEGHDALHYALAEPLNFQRKVAGFMRFTRASAIMVKVYVDGYYFQTQYKDDEGKSKGFVGICFYDDQSEYVFDFNLDDSENANSLRNAFLNFLRKTKGELPRELCMDKYTYKLLKTCLPKIFQFLINNGVEVNESSNPNFKSKIERFLGQLQQIVMPKSIYYLGPGVKSKTPLIHPPRAYKLMLSSKRFALNKYEMNRLLTTIWSVRYNKRHVGDDFEVPESRFLNNARNPVGFIKDLESYIPYLFFECHRSIKVTGRSVEIRLDEHEKKRSDSNTIKNPRNWRPRKNRSGNIYRNRSLEDINGRVFDIYVDVANPEIAHLYLPDTHNKQAEMKLEIRRPVAQYDRNIEDRESVKEFIIDSQKIRNSLEENDKNRLKRFKNATGKEFQELQMRAIYKKELEDADMAIQIGLTDRREEPILFNVNKSRHQRRLKTNLGDIGVTFNDTI